MMLCRSVAFAVSLAVLCVGVNGLEGASEVGDVPAPTEGWVPYKCQEVVDKLVMELNKMTVQIREKQKMVSEGEAVIPQLEQYLQPHSAGALTGLASASSSLGGNEATLSALKQAYGMLMAGTSFAAVLGFLGSVGLAGSAMVQGQMSYGTPGAAAWQHSSMSPADVAYSTYGTPGAKAPAYPPAYSTYGTPGAKAPAYPPAFSTYGTPDAKAPAHPPAMVGPVEPDMPLRGGKLANPLMSPSWPPAPVAPPPEEEKAPIVPRHGKLQNPLADGLPPPVAPPPSEGGAAPPPPARTRKGKMANPLAR